MDLITSTITICGDKIYIENDFVECEPNFIIKIKMLHLMFRYV